MLDCKTENFRRYGVFVFFFLLKSAGNHPVHSGVVHLTQLSRGWCHRRMLRLFGRRMFVPQELFLDVSWYGNI